MKNLRLSLIVIVTLLAVSFECEGKPLEAEKENAKEEINKLADLEDEITKELEKMEGELFDKSTELSEIENEVALAQKEITEKTERIEKLEKNIDAQKKLMSARIKFNYEQQGSTSIMWDLMTSKSLSDYLSKREYARAIAKYDERLITAYENNITENIKEKSELKKLSKNAKKKEERLKQQTDSLLSEISKSEEKYRQTRDERQKKEEELSRIIEKMRMYERLSGYGDDGMSLEEIYAIIAESEGTSGIPVYPAAGEESLLAAIIYCEAGGEPYEGQLAVGSVVLNRVNSSRFPGSITEVIYSPKQFTPAGSGRLAVALANNLTSDSCRMAARQVLTQGVTGSWLYFRVNDGSRQGQIIGRQVFY